MTRHLLNLVLATTLAISMTVPAIASTEPSSQALSPFKLTGDLRLRYEMSDTDADASPRRNRARLRARLGLEKSVNDMVTFHGQLSTGEGSDPSNRSPRSSNQSLDSSFSGKGIFLDLAYAKFRLPYAEVTAGKIRNPFWRVSDVIWDTDINPEGVAAHVPIGESAFLNAGLFVLEEDSSTHSDSLMLGIQGGVKVKVNDTVKIMGATSLYTFSEIGGKMLTHSSGTNTRDTSGGYVEDFSTLSLSGKVGIKMPHKKFLGFFSDYLINLSAENNKIGGLLGIKYGDKKVRNKWQWQIKSQYRYLQTDAILDTLPDSDAFGGATGIRGIELIAKLGLAKNLVLGLDYYISEVIATTQQQRLLQTDLSIRF